MRGGSAVMSNLMHRSFLFAVKVKDMMHKGVECVADSGRRCKAKDVMTSGIVYCRDNDGVEDAVRILEGR